MVTTVVKMQAAKANRSRRESDTHTSSEKMQGRLENGASRANEKDSTSWAFHPASKAATKDDC